MDIGLLAKLIDDAERRIGSFISSGGDQGHPYVQGQIAKITAWSEQINRLLENELD